MFNFLSQINVINVSNEKLSNFSILYIVNVKDQLRRIVVILLEKYAHSQSGKTNYKHLADFGK